LITGQCWTEPRVTSLIIERSDIDIHDAPAGWELADSSRSALPGPSDDARLRRVLILTAMDPWSASTRYRALQHIPRLRQRFGAVEVSLPHDTIRRSPGRIGQLRYFGTHGVRYIRRGLSIRQSISKYDSLLVQRGIYVIGPDAIAQPVDRFPGRVVFDLDDAVFRLSPSLAAKSRPARWLYGPQQALRLLRRADALIVSTERLAEMLPPGTPEPTILPTVPNPEDYLLAPVDPSKHPVIGWAGTVGGLVYLDPLRAVFASLARDGIATLEVVSSHPWDGPGRFHQWRASESTRVFARFSIGVMPLPDTDYTRAKAGFKLLQYMAAGLPVVASPVGGNRELVERSGAGFVAETPEDWESTLRLLAADPALRLELGRRGRSFVEGYADLDNQAQILTELLLP